MDESYLVKLDRSVHQDFIECLEEKRRDDEFETQSDYRLAEMERQKAKERKERYPK